MDQSLEGKVALLTGASSGLGRGFALALAAAGAKVFLVARREEKLREAVQEITEAGGEAAYHVVDLRSVPALYDLVDVLLSRYKRLDILVNNAGLGFRSPLLETRRSEIAEMLETNLASAIYMTQASLHALLKSAPSDIVNISSIGGLEGFAEGTVYCAAKAGLVGFTRAPRGGVETGQHPGHRDLSGLGRDRFLRPLPAHARSAADAADRGHGARPAVRADVAPQRPARGDRAQTQSGLSHRGV